MQRPDVLVNGINDFLISRHANVNRDWIVAFVEWAAENEPQLRGDQLGPAAFSQLLNSDLRAIGSKCLLPNIASNLNIMLSGYFLLQIMSVVDISQPAYQQLKKIAGVDDSNSKVNTDKDDDDDDFQKQMKKSASRTLMLNCTDGVQQIKCLEWKPVPCFNANMSSGCKILIHGEIECRRGVILLRNENTQLLGGEVEELLSQFSAISVLLNRLNIVPETEVVTEENHDSNSEEDDEDLFELLLEHHMLFNT